MDAIFVQELVIESENDEAEPTSAHYDIDQRDVILQSLESAISSNVNMSELKSLQYLSSDHIN